MIEARGSRVTREKACSVGDQVFSISEASAFGSHWPSELDVGGRL